MGWSTDTPAVIDVKGGGRFATANIAALEKNTVAGGAMFDCLLEISAHFQKKYPRIVIRFWPIIVSRRNYPCCRGDLVDCRKIVTYFAPITGDFSKADAPSNQVIYDSG